MRRFFKHRRGPATLARATVLRVPRAGLALLAIGWGLAFAADPPLNRPAQPRPLAEHPGNLFLEGEDVTLPLRGPDGGAWRLLDYEDQPVAELNPRDGKARLGRLPVGFYRLRRAGDTNTSWVSLGVLAPLQAPTPADSPVALDVAMAWFYGEPKMPAVANLCTLAGVNWVRDRLNWGHMEPERGRFAGANQYDASARAQSQAGLRVLQVNHVSPGWANPVRKRFPTDLRDAHRFYREMARRWRGQVLAFEPWNEADIPMFGGHTGGEMAALQKAATLGLKAGHPNVLACLNVFALHNAAQLEDLRDNEAWPYFDTFNLHHYEPFDAHAKLYADFRAVSAGRPLWVTEAALPVKWAGDEKLKEPTDADLRVQAERVAKTFAHSVHEGSAATFYFLLPHYVEGQTQFGLLRPDLTPRPGFVALAAVGRLMAGAKPLGRVQSPEANLRAFAFNVLADGRKADLVVAWAAEGQASLTLPGELEGLFDHLGRVRTPQRELRLTTAPVFALLAAGAASKLALQPPPARPDWLAGTPAMVVLQALWPEAEVDLKRSAYRLGAREARLPVYAYNFGPEAVRGRLSVAGPDDWKLTLPETVILAPDERRELALTIATPDAPRRVLERLRVTGDFGDAGRAVLSVRVMPALSARAGDGATALPEAGEAARWRAAVSGDGPATVQAREGAVRIQAEPAGPDHWVYPACELRPQERPPSGARGLAFTLRLLEGEGQFRVIFEEENGSSYVTELLTPPAKERSVETLALFEDARPGVGWSRPDPNQRLDPGQIRAVKIGGNTRGGRVRYEFSNLRWWPGRP